MRVLKTIGQRKENFSEARACKRRGVGIGSVTKSADRNAQSRESSKGEKKEPTGWEKTPLEPSTAIKKKKESRPGRPVPGNQ